MTDNGAGFLEVGTNDAHEVVVNLPTDMTGHIVFSPQQARALADSLMRKAADAERAHRDTLEAARIAAVPPVDRSKLCTTNQKPVADVRASQTNETGQHEGYIVLCTDERAKGFVRPYRDRYQHVGRSICGTVIVPPNGNVGRWEVKVCDDSVGHAGECGIVTRAVTAEQFRTQVETKHRLGGCGGVTTMGRALSETYARDPKFYGATFCCGCNRHLPVAEFVWTADGQEVGS